MIYLIHTEDASSRMKFSLHDCEKTETEKNKHSLNVSMQQIKENQPKTENRVNLETKLSSLQRMQMSTLFQVTLVSASFETQPEKHE